MSADPLWAPWRMEYILNDVVQKPVIDKQWPDGVDPDCFLCRASLTDELREAHVIERTDRVITVLNRYPYNNGHLLIGPREHLARLDQIDDALQTEIMKTVRRMTGHLERLMNPDGFNVGLNLGRVAGAGLPGHLHWHVVPRWNGDTNFMPVISDTNVIPQSLDTLWKLLRDELAREETS